MTAHEGMLDRVEWPATPQSPLPCPPGGLSPKPVQLASWRPGASRLAIAALRPRHSPASLVIGQYAR